MTAVAREARIRGMFPVVRLIARRVARIARVSDLDDLIGDGCVGLIKAVDAYDPSRGTPFELYARRLIAGGMLNGLRQRDPVSERVRRTMRRGEELRFAIAQERGSLPAFAELERDDPALQRARAAAYLQSPLSLDAPLPLGRDPLVDWSCEPSRKAATRERDRSLQQALALLPARERRILAMHYGGEQSLRAIGRTLRVSPQRVSQLHLHALARLRHAVARS